MTECIIARMSSMNLLSLRLRFILFDSFLVFVHVKMKKN